MMEEVVVVLEDTGTLIGVACCHTCSPKEEALEGMKNMTGMAAAVAVVVVAAVEEEEDKKVLVSLIEVELQDMDIEDNYYTVIVVVAVVKGSRRGVEGRLESQGSRHNWEVLMMEGNCQGS